jgi:hypothetical protein
MIDTLRPFIVAASAVLAAVVPHTEAESLSGKPVVLPDALAGRAAIFVVGFTRRSQSQTAAWSAQLTKDYGDEARLQRYSVAVLDDVPAFVRGMVVGGIRRGVPKEQHDAFLLVFHDGKAWKELAGVTNSDDAYVVLVDRTAHVVARAHGAVEESYASLRPAIRDAIDS